MTLSRLIMVLSLAVLAFVLYTTINDTEEQLTNTYEPMTLKTSPKRKNTNIERMTPKKVKKVSFKENMTNAAPLESAPITPKNDQVNSVVVDNLDDEFETRQLTEGFNYEDFEPNPVTNEVGGAPVDEMNDNLVDAEDEDLQIDGTDLLAAPLADRFHSLNSIANVNRNASNDLRGDIEIKYNDKYTPFYSSHIYGEPLHVNKLH